MKFSKKDSFTRFFLLIFVTFYFVFQLIYINADIPDFLARTAGTYCDEGYKTLDARNLALFGKAHWTEKDQYTGWIKGSPITVYFNFLLFKIFGVSLYIARMGNLLFALGCLILFYLILKKIFDRQYAVLGLILCAVNEIFFFYSRLALLEFKMMFFILLGVYFMLFVKRHYLFFVPAIISCIVAYYCKATAQIFYITIILYFIAEYKNGLLLFKMFRTKNLILGALIFLTIFLFLQYFFIYHREFYDSVRLFNRHYRSPAGTVFFWITQLFFIKNPILTFLAFIYTGYIIVLIMEGKLYDKSDLIFVIWLFLGTAIFAFVSFQQLGYYVYVVFPFIAVAVQGIIKFPLMWKTLFEENRLWFKGTIFVLGFYLLVIHSSFLRFMPVRTGRGWDIQAIKLFVVFSIITILILAVVYILLLRKKEICEVFFRIPYKTFYGIVLVLILGVHIVPITKWSLNPKYELAYISQKINELNDGSIIAGDWAPQICINTDYKVLYTKINKKFRRSQNFYNLDKVKPNYLVIVDGLNDYIFGKFKLHYPGVAKDTPRYTFNYAGRKILFYELDF